MIFKIVFHASGYEFNLWDNPKIAGFFVTVVVDALDDESAINLAYEMLVTSDKYTQLFPTNEHPSALIEVDSVSLCTDTLVQGDEMSGFIFYPPDEEADANNTIKH